MHSVLSKALRERKQLSTCASWPRLGGIRLIATEHSHLNGNLASNHTLRARVQAKLDRTELERPFSPSLIDTFGRKHDYLRISLTEKCNLRCFYCMPPEGVDLSPKSDLLTADEIIRLASLFVNSGVSKIRLTGGEPTVRKDIIEIIGRLSLLRPQGLKDIAMTSNGIALHRKLPELISNGLTHLNLSLDTLDPFKFEFITRRRGHEAVLQALEHALESQLKSVKLNVVVVKGLNDAEVPDFVAMTRNSRVSVRFIEYMPFAGNRWDRSKMVPTSDLIHKIQQFYPRLEKQQIGVNETAKMYEIPGHKGTFGFISSMSDHFCGSCNRLRVTADGQIKVCLFDPHEVSLRDLLRSSASDQELLGIIGRAVGAKKAKHAGMDGIDVIHNRPMIKIAPLPFVLPNLPRHPISARSIQRSYHTAPGLSHIDSSGRPKMVDVSEKAESIRSASASGRIYLTKEAFDLIVAPEGGETALSTSQRKAQSKGNVLITAQVAAVMGSKQTSTLIPLCHPLRLTKVDVHFVPDSATLSIQCNATVCCVERTGVEMEALTAVSVGLLTVWDMLKAVAGREMVIGDIRVTAKSGGRSDYTREQ